MASPSLTYEQVKAAGLRTARYWTPELEVDKRPDGTIYISQKGSLGDVPTRISDRLVYWAKKTPDALFLADRGPDGEWRNITYGEMVASCERLGQALLNMNLSVDRPLLILSGNSIEHARLALAAIYVGVPYAPVSEAYSLVSTDHSKLKDIMELLNPGLVFAADGEKFSAAIAGAVPADTPVLVIKNPPRPDARLFVDFAATESTPAVNAAREAVTPDTIAKFMFTSGSTGSPKAVINPNSMICANQMMVRDCYAFMQDEPPIVLDWAPWNHTAGGNKVFFMVMFNGGSLYIDDGRPTPAGMIKTIRNLREVTPTWYFNVPRGYEELVPALKADDSLRDHFFSKVKMLMYSGAGLAQHTWDDLERLAVEAIGERVLIAAGLGATETGPFAIMCTFESALSGNVGLPAKGMEMKLVPVDGKLEVRLKGPNVTPGYWKSPELTADSFDDEGFYNLGDALRFDDPDDVYKGFYFDGRTAENFKLRTGTWVSVGRLRAKLVDQFSGLVRDVAMTGLNEDYLGGLVFPDIRAVRALVPGFSGDDAALLALPEVRAVFAKHLKELAKSTTGSSTLIRRIILMDVPPNIDKGEITDKGSINQRAVRNHREADTADIYADSPRVIDIKDD